MRLRVIDLETTGTPPEADVIETAYVDVVGRPPSNETEGFAHSSEWRVEAPGWSTLVRPTRPIKVEARAVHHLSEEEVAGGRSWAEAADSLAHLGEYPSLNVSHPDLYCAHNATFEQQFFNPLDAQWICTYKAALRLWPEAPKHSNSVLRYWLDGCDPGEAGMPPHRALPDCRVTALILLRCLERASIEELVRWTEEPRLLPTIPFGKHAGARWEDVPRDYLQWVLRSDFEEDVKWNARRGLHDPGSWYNRPVERTKGA